MRKFAVSAVALLTIGACAATRPPAGDEIPDEEKGTGHGASFTSDEGPCGRPRAVGGRFGHPDWREPLRAGQARPRTDRHPALGDGRHRPVRRLSGNWEIDRPPRAYKPV